MLWWSNLLGDCKESRNIEHCCDVELVSEGSFHELLTDADSGTDPLVNSNGGISRTWSTGGFPASNSTGVYVGYCIICFTLVTALLLATLCEALAPQKESHLWKRRLRPWEEVTELGVGAALFLETLAAVRALGVRNVIRDRWRVFDASAAGLTFLCGFFFLCRRAVRKVGEEVVEDVDVPLLAVRFALQPLRLILTASKVYTAKQRQNVCNDEIKIPVASVRLVKPDTLSRPILTPGLASSLMEHMPSTCRLAAEWRLTYSPVVHGTSLKTFYRAQQGGPNVIIIREANGRVFGGFITESWRPERGNYGSAESFVFSVRGEVDEEPIVAEIREHVGCQLTSTLHHPSCKPEIFFATQSGGSMIKSSSSKSAALITYIM
eukprot:TRINITY_DN29360_c0_g1_i2.p1 TRINITY_DN29360_c0_g1~~TRINITY_DN29360_c0_g1_i2.p1  ORF type:complete len:379 (-),score=46.86 TRINITY_DN29360_c0_g1_i2:6-1142(-)